MKRRRAWSRVWLAEAPLAQVLHGAQAKELALGTVPPGASLIYTIELVHLEKARCRPLDHLDAPRSSFVMRSNCCS